VMYVRKGALVGDELDGSFDLHVPACYHIVLLLEYIVYGVSVTENGRTMEDIRTSGMLTGLLVRRVGAGAGASEVTSFVLVMQVPDIANGSREVPVEVTVVSLGSEGGRKGGRVSSEVLK